MKPMLAATCDDIYTLRYPVMVSPKLDGIRCILGKDGALSRSLKPIPNHHIQRTLRKAFNQSFKYDDVVFDGELIVGDNFQDCSSGIMSESGKPDFKYMIFDCMRNPQMPFYERLIYAFSLAPAISEMIPLLHKTVNSPEELEAFEEDALAVGHEGVMIRDPQGPYKYGRSTVNQGWLLKLKRFYDSEAYVVGVEALMHNDNEPTISETGYQVRSSHQANMLPMDTLGALKVVGKNAPFVDVAFNIGTGFTETDRNRLWDMREHLPGMVVKFKYQAFGVKDKPRIPVFLGFRDERDI